MVLIVPPYICTHIVEFSSMVTKIDDWSWFVKNHKRLANARKINRFPLYKIYIIYGRWGVYDKRKNENKFCF